MIFMHMTPPDLVNLLPSMVALVGVGVGIGFALATNALRRKSR